MKISKCRTFFLFLFIFLRDSLYMKTCMQNSHLFLVDHLFWLGDKIVSNHHMNFRNHISYYFEYLIYLLYYRKHENCDLAKLWLDCSIRSLSLSQLKKDLAQCIELISPSNCKIGMSLSASCLCVFILNRGRIVFTRGLNHLASCKQPPYM